MYINTSSTHLIEVKFTRRVELLEHVGYEPIRTPASARALETAETHMDRAATVTSHCVSVVMGKGRLTSPFTVWM